MKTKRKEAVNLDHVTGFELTLFDADGNVVDSVGTFSPDNAQMMRGEVILISAARTLAYMFWYLMGKRRDKQTYNAHVRDFIRKATDYLKAIDERW